ncbi:hypothetical protein [Streptomyces coeruleorubidus]
MLNGSDPVLQREADVAAPTASALAAVHSGFLRATGATSAVTVPLGSRR